MFKLLLIACILSVAIASDYDYVARKREVFLDGMDAKDFEDMDVKDMKPETRITRDLLGDIQHRAQEALKNAQGEGGLLDRAQKAGRDMMQKGQDGLANLREQGQNLANRGRDMLQQARRGQANE